MFKKIKKLISKSDQFLYKKFGSNRGTKFLENIKEAHIIFSYLNKIGEESKVRFVGGCVRKSILGKKIDDIDLATSLKPNEVKEKLDLENIKILDTGISHGTLTVILNKKKFEVTTLRKDILTDGRHADIDFTLSWKDDAERRDFTINSIYADINGRIYDPLNGLSDLQNGKIKFIGNAEERIQEDYLRILRYFRFFTQYSNEDHNQDTIRSIKKYINGLNKISNERIFDELKKTLCLENIYNLFSNKESKSIILNIFPQFKFYERLKVFKTLGKKLRDSYDYKLILALLILDESDHHDFFCYKYKVSNNINKMFKNISKNYKDLKNKKFYLDSNIKKLIYLNGKNSVKEILLFARCANNKINNSELEEMLNYVEKFKIPKFPISGEDLKKHGYESGEALGRKLKFLEQKWIENNFIIDKDLLKKSLN
ncbi:CCA tRNA nucleotidyltransferase [Pelagibacteraceae bacterium]|jgi:poly(A) polymerase|nr:CCA tRNA nucleotidyltransferase [Pelagibacteraceae bacterium]